jgi:hypothetical protein
MFEFIVSTFSVVAVLILWFRTNAVLEYAQFFGLERAFGIEKWQEAQKVSHLSWLEWLVMYYGSWKDGDSIRVRIRGFVVRMLSCPYCFGLWLSLAAAGMSGHLAWFLAIYAGAMLLFKFF